VATPFQKSELLVRQATAADLPQLIELRWASSIEDDVVREPRPAFEARMRAFLERAIADPRWAVWVAADGDRLVTTVYAQIVPKVPRPSPSGAWVYLAGMFTRAERRGEGIGSRVWAPVRRGPTRRGFGWICPWQSERPVPF